MKVNVRYERVGNCFWHDCHRFGSPMKIGRNEERGTLLTCTRCGIGAWFPVGGVGDVQCESLGYEPTCDGCGKTIADHDAMLRCKTRAEDDNDRMYAALSALAGIDTSETNLRDQPEAYEVLDKLMTHAYAEGRKD